MAKEASRANSQAGYYWEPPWDSTSEGRMHDNLCCWCAWLPPLVRGSNLWNLFTYAVLYKIHIKKTTQVEWALFSTFGEFSGNFPIPDVLPSLSIYSRSIWWWYTSNRLLLVKKKELIEVLMSNWFNSVSWNSATHSIRIITIHLHKSNIWGKYIKLKSNWIITLYSVGKGWFYFF